MRASRRGQVPADHALQRGGRGLERSRRVDTAGRQHLCDRPASAGGGHEQRPGRAGQAQRLGQQPGRVLAGGAVDSPFQIADRSRAQPRPPARPSNPRWPARHRPDPLSQPTQTRLSQPPASTGQAAQPGRPRLRNNPPGPEPALTATAARALRDRRHGPAVITARRRRICGCRVGRRVWSCPAPPATVKPAGTPSRRAHRRPISGMQPDRPGHVTIGGHDDVP